MTPVAGCCLLAPGDHDPVVAAPDLGLKLAVLGGLQVIPGGGVGQGMAEGAVMPVIDTAIGQGRRLADDDAGRVGVQHRRAVAFLHRGEQLADQPGIGGGRGLGPAAGVGDLTQLADPAVAQGEHMGERGLERHRGVRWLAGIGPGDDHRAVVAAEEAVGYRPDPEAAPERRPHLGEHRPRSCVRAAQAAGHALVDMTDEVGVQQLQQELGVGSFERRVKLAGHVGIGWHQILPSSRSLIRRLPARRGSPARHTAGGQRAAPRPPADGAGCCRRADRTWPA